ncbi:biorientation of chromosomes in cell division protein 1-like 1 isoform X2 [Opisthocomus hoazin]|uniref:biorientation of chromosomes in cell division protein 1-like 1 isoform X2 n=1 Tax=Opisthocomus hoazin TaxID=30419 RepID=UPI003F52C4DA
MASNPQPQPPPPPPPPPPPQQPPPLPGAGAAAGGGAAEPELVSMIVSHLKSQGLFDQFRRDCLADVDTKPAYQNLRQRVDNFVSNHLATHTWSPHLNKNQLRNNIRQQVLKSGMLESGIDRIISQVVDPKINHTFRPQVEKAVHEFLATLNHKEEAGPSTAPSEEKTDASVTVQGVSATAPSGNVASDAMSILETITSLNQEASAARTSTENSNPKNNDRVAKRLSSQQSVDGSADRERNAEDLLDREKAICDPSGEGAETFAKCEDLNELPCQREEIKNSGKDTNNLTFTSKEIQQESEDQKSKLLDKCDKKPDSSEKGERRKEKKEKLDKKSDHSKKSDDTTKSKEEKQARESEPVKQLVPEKNSNKHKTAESTKETKEENTSIDSDMDVLSDITVSSVHTSDLSSFEEESEEEPVISDSTEEGEITSDDEEEKNSQSKTKPHANELSDGKAKPVRHAYVRKPFLYSKYFSDSDDERTVEQRRQSIAKEKEERLLRRQINRERLEEKRKQKAAEKTKSLKTGSQNAKGKSSLNLEEPSSRSVESKATGTSIKDVLKEQKFLEKKVALSRKRKRDSRHAEDGCKKKYEPSEEDSKEMQKTSEICEKNSSKEMKHNHGKNEISKQLRRLSESVHSTEESKSDSKAEKEYKRKTSTSVQAEGAQQDSETRDSKRQIDRAEVNTEELQKQKSVFKNEKHPKKDSDSEIQYMRNAAKKETKSYRDKNDKERTALEDKLSVKHKYKGDGLHKSGDDVELHSFERSLKGEDGGQKHNQQIKVSSDDKSERKSKHRSERKISVTGKDGKNTSESTSKAEELLRKENKKDRHLSTEKPRAEYKSKRSLSDSRPQKDSLSASKQLASVSHRRSESCSEDKHEIESTNSDCNLKQEDGVHKDRRRSKSLVEDKILLKSKSKSHSKQFKASEMELQENLTKQETVQKPDKDKSMEGNDSDKQHKSKNEDKGFEENGAEFELASGMQSTQGSQKDFSHRVKLHSGERGSVKEKYRSDKDLNNSKLERRFSAEGHKSRNLKHSNKEIKKKEESIKLEDKDTKEMDSGHEKALSITVAMDKKQSKKISCENRKGSRANQDLLGEEMQSGSTTESSHAPAPLKSSMSNDDSHSGHEEELMEVDLKQTKVQEASAIEGKNIPNSLQATDAEYAEKENISLSISNKELKHSLAGPGACEPQFLPAAEKTVKQEDIPNKQVGALDTLSKQASMDQGPNKQGAYKINMLYETSGRILLNVPSKDQASEDSRRPKNLRTVINSNSDDVPLAINSSREDAADAKSMDMDISDFIGSLGSISKECRISEETSLFEDSFSLKNDAAQVVYREQEDSAVLSSVMKDDGDNTTMTNSIDKDNEVPQPDEQAMEDSTAGLHGQEDYDEAAKLESAQGSELKIKEENLVTVITEDCGEVTTKELLLKGRKCLNTDPSTKEEKSTMMDNVEKNEVHDIDDMIQSSSILVPERVPEETVKGSVIASGQEGNSVVGMEDKNESSAVGTSAGSSKLGLLYGSLQTTPATVTGTSTEKITESTVMATSTGEERAESASHSEKDSDATTTCSEEESEVAVICTSIEADEGFTTGVWVKSSEEGSFITEGDFGDCTVAAAEEGGGSVVTEGLAESESFLTSTEGEENGDYAMVDAEGSGKDSVNASGVEVEDSVNSAGSEEKDDAVTSAGSEENRKTSACVNTGKFESSVSCLGEVESDGAVTSAGTETGEGSTSGDSSVEFRGSVRAGQVKEHEGTVTCTGAEERGHNFIICSVTGTDAQGESTVTGACIAMVTNDSATTGTSGDKSEDTVNGESTVTSTGITPEDDAEISIVCTGLEDSNEGFAVCLEAEKCESLMDSTRAKEESNITTVSVGLCDDEGFVTSTGSKEEDEEGEGIVTSTGRGNEENEHASTCTGMEGENALICIGAEGESSIICIVAEQMEAESGVAGTNINKLTVDSMMNAEKEANYGTNCKNDKGIVESSVTSASAADAGALAAHIGKHEDTLIPLDAEECEGPMTSAMAVQDQGQSGAEDEHETAMTSFGSRELDASISSAVPQEDENSLTSADREEKVKGDIISTSTVEESDVPLHSAMDAEEGPLAVARADEGGESSMILLDTEDTEVPMSSTATEFKECLHTFSSKQEKDECTMISTSIVEEFEAPMSSAAIEYDGQLPSVKAEEINENAMVSIDMEIYEVPMPSESSAGGDDNNDESHPTASSKEEKDECAMISTSVAEEQVVLMSGEVTEEVIQHVSDTESKNETVMISTSTAECFEAPMSSVAMQDENKLAASETEGRYEAAMITTSMTEECEIVLISAAPQAGSQLIVAEEDEDAVISPNASEECKLVETTATVDEQFGLAAFNADAKSKGSVIFVGECRAPVLRVATNSEDQHSASSIGDKEEGAVITLSTMEECDSLFTFTVIEESQLAAESTEVQDKSEEIFNTDNQIECILSTTGPEKSSNSLLVIGSENETQESGVKAESAAPQTTADSEITETDENSVNLMSVDEALCVEISTETAVSPSPSSEASEDDEQAEGVLHEDVTSELSCTISEAGTESETLRNVNYKFNSDLLLESDFSEIRTPLPRAQALSLVSANEVATNANHGEVTLEAELEEKSDFPVLQVEELYGSDDKTNLIKIDDTGIEVTFQKSNATFNSGNNAALPKLAEELEFESNLRSDEQQPPVSPRSEEGCVDLHTEDFQKDLLQRSIAVERETFHLENMDTQVTEEHRSRGIQCKSSGTMDKEKCSQLIAQDVRKDDEQSQCCRTKADNVKEVISGDTAEVSKEIDVKHTPPKSTMEEKDEFMNEQEMSEKKHGLESNENSPEENQPVIVKRKRGRPRKYPLEAVQPGGGESKADMSTGNLQFPVFESRGKPPQTGTDISNKTETTNEDEAEKAEMIVRKRGRKPRRSLVQSEETGLLESYSTCVKFYMDRNTGAGNKTSEINVF